MSKHPAIKPILIGVGLLALVVAGVLVFVPHRPAVLVTEETTDLVETDRFDFLGAAEQVLAPELGKDEASGPIPINLVGTVRFILGAAGIYLAAVLVVRAILKAFGRPVLGRVFRYSLYVLLVWIGNKALSFLGINLGGFVKSAVAPLTQARNAAGSVQVIATQSWIDKFGSVITIIIVAGGVLLLAQALIKGLIRKTTPARRAVMRQVTQVRGKLTRRNMYISVGIALALVLVWAQFAGQDLKNPQTWIPAVFLAAGLLGLFLTLNIYGTETSALAQQALSQLPQVNLVNAGQLIWQGGRLVFLLAIFLGIAWTGAMGSVPFLGLLGSSTAATLTAQILSNRLVLAMTGGAILIVITRNRVQ